ncbi:hypothetical protein TorRG33x02_053750 [Trema orientale]|uniref:Uncharacterized protein n=1 Tax=Trema orientale TaxID=63057 RepID=A0A2P5FLV3_TREOI|nr:hypothetical protein TorRG33x02_053750 [Trema orientale]
MARSQTEKATTFGSGEGEKASNMSAAMIPTGKKSSINGGGGRGGKINGKITIDVARAASTRTEPKLRHRLISDSQVPYL